MQKLKIHKKAKLPNIEKKRRARKVLLLLEVVQSIGNLKQCQKEIEDEGGTRSTFSNFPKSKGTCRQVFLQPAGSEIDFTLKVQFN